MSSEQSSATGPVQPNSPAQPNQGNKKKAVSKDSADRFRNLLEQKGDKGDRQEKNTGTRQDLGTHQPATASNSAQQQGGQSDSPYHSMQQGSPSTVKNSKLHLSGSTAKVIAGAIAEEWKKREKRSANTSGLEFSFEMDGIPGLTISVSCEENGMTTITFASPNPKVRDFLLQSRSSMIHELSKQMDDPDMGNRLNIAFSWEK